MSVAILGTNAVIQPSSDTIEAISGGFTRKLRIDKATQLAYEIRQIGSFLDRPNFDYENEPVGRVTPDGKVHFFTISEKINWRIARKRIDLTVHEPEDEPEDEPEEKEISPQVRTDKIMLRMPATVTFNRENLRVYYRKVALRFHPDKNPGKDTTETFRKIQAAYERLLLEASE